MRGAIFESIFPGLLMQKMSRAQIRCKSALSAAWRAAAPAMAIQAKSCRKTKRSSGMVQHKYAASDHHGNVPGSPSQRRPRFCCVVLPRGRYEHFPTLTKEPYSGKSTIKWIYSTGDKCLRCSRSIAKTCLLIPTPA